MSTDRELLVKAAEALRNWSVQDRWRLSVEIEAHLVHLNQANADEAAKGE